VILLRLARQKPVPAGSLMPHQHIRIFFVGMAVQFKADRSAIREPLLGQGGLLGGSGRAERVAPLDPLCHSKPGFLGAQAALANIVQRCGFRIACAIGCASFVEITRGHRSRSFR